LLCRAGRHLESPPLIATPATRIEDVFCLRLRIQVHRHRGHRSVSVVALMGIIASGYPSYVLNGWLLCLRVQAWGSRACCCSSPTRGSGRPTTSPLESNTARASSPSTASPPRSRAGTRYVRATHRKDNCWCCFFCSKILGRVRRHYLIIMHWKLGLPTNALACTSHIHHLVYTYRQGKKRSDL